jgi:hypothetical protein
MGGVLKDKLGRRLTTGYFDVLSCRYDTDLGVFTKLLVVSGCRDIQQPLADHQKFLELSSRGGL